MNTKWPTRILTALAGVACMAPGCEGGDVLKDPSFRLWDGDTLVAWRLDEGRVRKAPTWHPDDPGVELLDTPTQIAQSTAKATSCMAFTAVVDVDAAAQVRLGVDLDFDGVDDFTWPIPETHWRATQMLIHLPGGMVYPTEPSRFGVPTPMLRVSLRKEGPGRAVLARIRLTTSAECSGQPIELRHRPIGAVCAANAQCESGVCNHGQGRGVCSECDGEGSCPGGAACAVRTERLTLDPLAATLPAQCAPSSAASAAGRPCLGSSDCTSGVCEGAASFRDPACVDTGATCTVLSVRAGRCR